MAEPSAREFDARYNPGHAAIRAEAANREAGVVLEPFFWGLFSLGGFITAFLLPVTLVALGFLVPVGIWPAGRIDYVWLQGAMNPAAPNFTGLLVRLFFLVLIASCFFHGAHRFSYTVAELTHHRGEKAISGVFHGLAVLGSLIALYTVLVGWLL